MFISAGGWELRTFVRVEGGGGSGTHDGDEPGQDRHDGSTPGGVGEVSAGGDDGACCTLPSVWAWAKHCKAQRKQLQGKQKEQQQQKKKKLKKEQKKAKKGGGGGPIEERTDYYVHLSPCGGSTTTTRSNEPADPPAAAAEEDEEGEVREDPSKSSTMEGHAHEVEQWMESGCGLKLRGNPSGYQLELKVRTSVHHHDNAAAAADQAGGGKGAMEVASGGNPELWVKVSLPSIRCDHNGASDGGDASDDIEIPPRNTRDIASLHRVLGRLVADEGGGSSFLEWRTMLMKAASLLGLRSPRPETSGDSVRARVALAQETIRRRLLIHPDDCLGSPEPLPTSQESAHETTSHESQLCGIWRTDKARRQRCIRWWPPGKFEKSDRVDLVVEQTVITVATYVPTDGNESGALQEDQRGKFISVCVEGGDPETLRQFMLGYISWLPPMWQRSVMVAGYPAWIASLAREDACLVVAQ